MRREALRNSSATELLAQQIVQSSWMDVTNEVRLRIKDLLLDWAGCALAGARVPEGRCNFVVARHSSDLLAATVVGGRCKTSVASAARANAQISNVLDFDDTYDFFSPDHPGCIIIPAALAIGEAGEFSGRAIIEAIAVGYDVSMHVGRALGSSLWSHHGVSVPRLLGSAAVACKLWRMDQASVRACLELVALEAFVEDNSVQRECWDVSADDLSDLKGNFGESAEAGILAAIQARSGIRGKKGFLDIDFRDWYLAGLPVEGYEILHQRAGSHDYVMDVSMKPAPSCRATHAALTAVWDATRKQPVDPRCIRRIIVTGVERLHARKWQTMVGAQFSTPCAIALSLCNVAPGPDWYQPAHFLSAEVHTLAGRVEFVRDAAAEELEIRENKTTCEVQIELVNGSTLCGRCDDIKGSPGNPMTRQEITEKFLANSSHVPAPQRRQLVHMLSEFDSLDSISDLTSLLACDFGKQ